MEQIQWQPVRPQPNPYALVPVNNTATSIKKPFIEANTKAVTMHHLKNDCIVPVFSKDNEITLSHNHFIETVRECAGRLFQQETIGEPEIRVSHVIKGRTPEAIHKPVGELTDADKTIYYERMMFCIEIPTITETIEGNRLNLTIGGVRAYNHENLYSKKGMERFKVFIGFKNMVCCNLCVSTDGLCEDIRVMSVADLTARVVELLVSYNVKNHLNRMRSFQNHALTESQFAQFIGKSRLYQCLPGEQKRLLPPFLMTDTQINLVAKSYFHDKDFGVGKAGEELSMWKIYNLLTGANKSSYIDNFPERALNAAHIAEGITCALQGEGAYGWFIR